MPRNRNFWCSFRSSLRTAPTSRMTPMSACWMVTGSPLPYVAITSPLSVVTSVMAGATPLRVWRYLDYQGTFYRNHLQRNKHPRRLTVRRSHCQFYLGLLRWNPRHLPAGQETVRPRAARHTVTAPLHEAQHPPLLLRRHRLQPQPELRPPHPVRRPVRTPPVPVVLEPVPRVRLKDRRAAHVRPDLVHRLLDGVRHHPVV